MREFRQKTGVDGEMSLQAFGGQFGKKGIPGVLINSVQKIKQNCLLLFCLCKQTYSEDSVGIVNVLGTI